MMNESCTILEFSPSFYVNKTKVFEIKLNPILENEFTFCDLEGKISFASIQENSKIKIHKRLICSKNSIQTIDFSYDGEKLILGSSSNELSIIQNYKFLWRKKMKYVSIFIKASN